MIWLHPNRRELVEIEEQPLGTRVRTARQGLGWGQVDLAKHVGVTQATVSRIEAGGKFSTLVGRAFETFLADAASGALAPVAEPAPANS
ncbi:MAG: helix-turn-helix transcriptional regulator [Devosia sp.]|uniref:helix-turn-helix domain-containing protein n=1 Tax=Devosia sp. TaxID=1871048 RepID=UPI001AD0E6F2|nr:helix-turn-helix transcriptional regulator [Devosia sp.]